MQSNKLYENYIYVLNAELDLLSTNNKKFPNVFDYVPGLKKRVFKTLSIDSELYLMNIDNNPVGVEIMKSGYNYIVSVITLEKLNSIVSELNTVKDMAIKDELTGVHNRYGYKIFFRNLLIDSIAKKFSIGLILVDIDNLKAVNSKSYVQGDKVMKGIATALQEISRKDDLIIRIGGDEFLLVNIYKIRDDIVITKHIRRILKHIRASKVSNTVSIGAYILSKSDVNRLLSAKHFSREWDDYIQKLDTDLKIAKASGKDKAYFNGVEIS